MHVTVSPYSDIADQVNHKCMGHCKSWTLDSGLVMD